MYASLPLHWRVVRRAFLLLATFFAVHAVRMDGSDLEAGQPFLQNFGLRDYHAHNQNWSAAQDERGVLYFGNKSVVLEYDGVSWRKLPVGETTYVRGLAFDPSRNAIFVGAVDELGYLRLDPEGGRTFVSLLDQLPAEARGFRDIRRVYALAGGAVVFVADAQVMRWRAGKFTVWRPGNIAALTSFLVDGRLFVHAADLGLRRLEGEEFVPVAPAADFLRENPLNVLLAGAAPGELLAGTPLHGLWRILADGSAAPFPTGADAFLQKNKLRRGLRLSDNTLALATGGAGLVWLGADGRFLGRVDESTGLQNDQILNLFNDREGGLWLGLNSGLTRVELSTGLTVFDASNGLKHTTVHDVARVGGTVLVAANSGLYRLVPAEPGAEPRPAGCERLAEGEFWSLGPDGVDGALAGGPDGVYRWRPGGQTTRVLSVPGQTLAVRLSRRNPARVWFATREGLRSLRREGEAWQDEGLVPGCAEESRTIVEASDGAVWLGTPTHGIFRVVFAGDGTGPRGTATVTGYFKTHGLPLDTYWTRVVAWHDGGGVLFATQAGLFRYDAVADRFARVFDYGPHFGDGTFMLGNVAEDAAEGLWLAGRSAQGIWPDQELGRAEQGGGPWEPLPNRIADKIGEIEHILPEVGPDGSGVVWYTGTDGMVRVEVGSRRQTTAKREPAFGTFIRRVLTMNGGPKALPAGGGYSVPASQNSLRFEFAADTFRYGAGLRYRTRLDGLPSAGWSDFSAESGADYTNLPAGSYTFRVLGRDVDGHLGREATVAFRVLPRWSKTVWAWMGYVLVGVAAVAGLVRWRLGRAHRETAQLETRVFEQTAELVRARDAAESANRAKSAFLANMSHELRTPLNAVLGYAQIMLKDPELSAKNRTRLGVVARSGEHLLGMINEVLDLSKIEAGKLALDPVDFPLDRLLDAAAEAFRPRAAEKNIAFALSRDPGLPVAIHGDEGKLRQILFNLLGNAIKFTDRGGVELKVQRVGEDRLSFEVRDTGIGVAGDEQENIFLAFHQADGSGAALAAQGTGLGLAISQRLVAMLGGSLRVASVLGEGSRFWFELPLREAAAWAEASTSPVAAPGATITGYRGPRARVLVVDDDETNRRILAELLTPLGFEVEEISGGGECLARCARAPWPDLVLLDLRMPNNDGFNVARALRRRSESVGLKIIAVSASVFEADRKQALDAGCDEFLPKPFAEAALVAALGRVLGLEWITAPAVPASASQSVSGGEAESVPPPTAELDALLELSRRGDILKIRRRLADLLVAEPRHAPFVKPLEDLAASYQMNRLREALRELQHHER